MDTTTFLRIERTNRLGRLGEQLAEERLVDAGFKDVRNLNRGMNFLIRNDKKQMLERLGKTEAEITAILWDGVDQIAARWKAVPAWVTVAMRPERGTYSAYYGLVSAIRNRRSIPMTLAGRSGYTLLAPIGNKDPRVSADLLNRDA